MKSQGWEPITGMRQGPHTHRANTEMHSQSHPMGPIYRRVTYQLIAHACGQWEETHDNTGEQKNSTQKHLTISSTNHHAPLQVNGWMKGWMCSVLLTAITLNKTLIQYFSPCVRNVVVRKIILYLCFTCNLIEASCCVYLALCFDWQHPHSRDSFFTLSLFNDDNSGCLLLSFSESRSTAVLNCSAPLPQTEPFWVWAF